MHITIATATQVTYVVWLLGVLAIGFLALGDRWKGRAGVVGTFLFATAIIVLLATIFLGWSV